MKLIKYMTLTLFMGVATLASAQTNVDPERKQAIDSLALEKVKDLSKYISIIWCEIYTLIELNSMIFFSFALCFGCESFSIISNT